MHEKKTEAFFTAQKTEIETEYADKIYESQLERKYTGLVDMEQSIEQKADVSGVPSEIT